MIRHCVHFQFTVDTTSADIDRIHSALASLPPLISSVRSYVHGRDLGVGSGTWAYGITADFDDIAGWEAYDQHPAHLEVRALMVPHIAERSSLRMVF
jgi:hypothetical protein